jgi:NAD(P)-dependent dehydrogenase (short-subunit alcohol dehydrogenase family)
MAAAGPLTFKGKIVIVTGGARGIGRAISEAFASHGAAVALAGRNTQVLEDAARSIAASGGSAKAFAADVSKEESVAALCSGVLDTYGRIDVLINNAGINPWYKNAEDTSLSEWQQIIDTNLTGVFLACKYAGRAMIAAGQGAIVNISSIAGRVGLPRSTAYCAAKGGVELLTRELAYEWAKKGVRVNSVAPGFVETDLTHGMSQHPVLGKRITDRTPMGRFGETSEVAGACLFLASPAASYITGCSITVDGGWTAA